MGDAKSLAHTKWNCKYHIVFAPKYRRQVFYGEKKRAVGEILRKLCEWKGVTIVEAECCFDHIHMLLEIPPKMSVSGFMGYLKGKSSLMLYEQFGDLKFKYRDREFWFRGYYVDTVGKNKTKIQEYIKHQLDQDKLGDQLSLPYPARLRAASNRTCRCQIKYAPVRALLVTEPYRRIGNTPGFAGGYLLIAREKPLPGIKQSLAALHGAGYRWSARVRTQTVRCQKGEAMGKIYRLPLKQSIGVAAKPAVTAGRAVRRGTLLAVPEGLGVPLHASVNGVIGDITETYIDIEADAAQEEGFEPIPPNDDIVETVKAAGICGMGGAGFPTYVKLGTRLDGGTLIVNAVECEPVLHHNITQIENSPDKVCRGLLLAMKATSAARGIFAIKAKNKAAVAALKSVVKDRDNILVHELPDRYPMGEERAIIRETLNRLLKVDELPSAAGAVIINAETLSRIAEAVDERRPVISKNLTVAGKAIRGKTPRVFMDVPLGVFVRDLIDEAGGLEDGHGEIIMGGPFTGRRTDLDEVVVKTTGGILVSETCRAETLPMGILVCACGPNGLRMRQIAGEMGASVVAVQVCKQALLVKGMLKCENPGICPGQVGKMTELKDAGAEALLIGTCFDCTSEIMREALKLGLKIHHVTDPVMSGVGLPPVRGFPESLNDV